MHNLGYIDAMEDVLALTDECTMLCNAFPIFRIESSSHKGFWTSPFVGRRPQEQINKLT